jgi:hypothetical protein
MDGSLKERHFFYRYFSYIITILTAFVTRYMSML